MTALPSPGWTPVRVARDARAGWTVDWCRLGDQRFTDPFFEETIDRALLRPFNLTFRRRTPLGALAPRAGGPQAVRPAGLILHVSRSGSTLVSQMLAALPDSVVLSEAVPVDDVLGAHLEDPEVTDDWRAERLQWIVNALGRSVPGDPLRLVVKLDAWHAVDLDVIRRAFPGVPSIVVYRDPLEVLASHGRRAGWMMLSRNAKRMLGIDAGIAATLAPRDYPVRVLERIFACLVSDGDPATRLVNYDQLPDLAFETIPRWFGIHTTDDDRSLMAVAARRDAKQPMQEFLPDGEEKRRSADPATRAAVAAKLAPLYEALEARRLRQR